MPTMEEVVEALSQMSVMDVIGITRDLEKLWGVEAKPQVVLQQQKKEEETGPAQTDFSVVLASVPSDKKMSVIKAVRDAVTGLGLKEAKELVEAAPKVVREGMDKADAEALKAKLVEAGAVVELK